MDGGTVNGWEKSVQAVGTKDIIRPHSCPSSPGFALPGNSGGIGPGSLLLTTTRIIWAGHSCDLRIRSGLTSGFTISADSP